MLHGLTVNNQVNSPMHWLLPKSWISKANWSTSHREGPGDSPLFVQVNEQALTDN